MIKRTVKAASFLAGIQVVNQVAVVAEDLDHHPDIDIRYSTLHFTLSTHDAGGITSLDTELARHIDGIVREHAG
jgi:4a-hydroxytetrahydrobiopterin dehydratase